MSRQPISCHRPELVWFETEAMAKRNTDRKNASGLFEFLWKRWRCHDHWHIRPKGRQS